MKAVRRYYENDKLSLKDVKEIKQQWEEKNIPGQIEMAIPAPDQEEKTEVQAPTFTMIQQPEDKQASIIKESVDSLKTEVDDIKEKTDTVLPVKKEYAWGVREPEGIKQEEPIQEQKEQREEIKERTAEITGDSVTNPLTEIDGIPGQWYKLSDNIVPFPFVPVLVATEILNNSIRVHEGFRRPDNTWRVATNNKWGDGEDITTGRKKIFAWMQMPEYKEE